ncbi:DMT family transporter [Vibrio crassostreae]|uniref:DMT family transporter n=1 Tax=Vibrio crassostreae TaxID=246167 RepID=UPI00104CA71D|nr:DMT family transporter [Vibrio crassostreae]TCO01319.1 threonine/homoserine efflux transporter RhtA [Vibrio crassostreae]CAK2100830.1 Threonine/homoserine efflux transporter RhtA [Vibrio crassostreae]CAK2102462.1 Threonine/homoserine efflux transporter RhtA [Vibrio crassostreae]CAK2109129.1 Threonine/homoserine efflux transporter RhtA [Vibrio crassostreae]CAK2892916.1 Threonine/homoserine efflux transporter RhtA [Vibrio crassostreae]
MSDITKATTFMLLSTFSLSLSGLMAKYLSEVMPTSLLSFVRFLLPSLFLFLFLTFYKISKPTREMWKPLVMRAIFMVACQWCFLTSLQTLTLVEGVVLFSTGPLFIPLLEKLIFGTKIHTTTIVCLAVTFVGVVMMAGDWSQFEFGSEFFRPALLLGLLAGMFNSGSQVSLYRASKTSLSPAELNAWTFLVAAIIVIPMVVFTSISEAPEVIESTGSLSALLSFDDLRWIGLGAFGLALFTINTQIFRSKAYKLADSGSQLAPLIFTNMLFSALWQGLFFDDVFSTQQMIGINLIVVASITNTLLAKRHSKAKAKQKPHTTMVVANTAVLDSAAKS